MTRERSFEESARRDARDGDPATSERSQGSGSAEGETIRSQTPELRFEREIQIRLRNKTFQLSPAESRTAYEVGRFRAIDVPDLKGFRITGQDPEVVLLALNRKKLIKSATITVPGQKEASRVVVLTKLGRELVRRAYGASCEQQFYTGLVKTRELKHDTAIYRMFQAEAKRIKAKGGTIHRVVLDHELKRHVFSALELGRREKPPRTDAELQQEIASRHQLRVVNGKIPLPDLRIEYGTVRGELKHIDLELATGHYKASQRAEKARAGFQIYTLGSRAGGTPYGEDLIREVFSR